MTRYVDLDDHESLGRLAAWLEPVLRLRGRVDSTENAGGRLGVHSLEPARSFEAEGSVLRADGAGGSLWGGVPSGGVSLEDVIRASSLSGFWKFDESSGTTAADSSGNGRDLSSVSFSAPTWAQAAGPPGTLTAAWSSNAQAVTRANYPSVASANFSVFGWVYLTSDSATDLHVLFGQGQNLFAALNVIGWSLGVGGVGNYGRKLLLGLGNNSALDLNIGDNTLALNTWYHVGFVYSSGVSTMYVNGAAQSDTSSQAISTGSQTLVAGNDAIANSIQYLRGRLSWWAIWDTALTAAQVFNQYTVGANPSGAPVGYLIESDGSGSTRWIPADEVALTDVTTGDASTTKHGWAKKLSGVATEFFRGDGTYAAVTDAILSTSDVTTNNATTSKHGFLKKLSNVATEVMNGAGNWIGVVTGLSKSGSTVLTGPVTLTGGSNVTLTQTSQDITIAATVVGSGAVDSIAKSGSTPLVGAITLTGGTGVTLTQAGNDISIASGAGIGSMSLVYRYTVAGSDKASIDTGADTADAGSNDWTNGDLLLIYMLLRSDNAAARVSPVLTVNNDTGANYDLESVGGVNATSASAPQLATAGWSAGLDIHGSGGGASYATAIRISIPAFTRTTFFKAGELTGGTTDSTAANNAARVVGLGWRSTAAITRFKAAAGGTDKFKVGSQLLIYKVLAS